MPWGAGSGTPELNAGLPWLCPRSQTGIAPAQMDQGPSNKNSQGTPCPCTCRLRPFCPACTSSSHGPHPKKLWPGVGGGRELCPRPSPGPRHPPAHATLRSAGGPGQARACQARRGFLPGPILGEALHGGRLGAAGGMPASAALGASCTGQDHADAPARAAPRRGTMVPSGQFPEFIAFQPPWGPREAAASR